jgi:hypothetical protein
LRKRLVRWLGRPLARHSAVPQCLHGELLTLSFGEKLLITLATERLAQDRVELHVEHKSPPRAGLQAR